MRIPAYVMFGIAGLALLVAAVLGFRSAALVIGGERVAGEVVRIAGDDQAGSYTVYRPVIGFIDTNNEPAEWTGRGERSASTYGPGDKVVLLRERGAEPRIELNEFSVLWAAVLACVGLAWTFGGVGVLMRLADAESPGRLGAAFGIFFGLPLLAGGIASAIGDLAALRGGAWATGTIANGGGVAWTLVKSDGASGGQLPAVVKMTAADGRSVEFTDSQVDATYLAKGAQVEVVYPPGRPYAGRVYEPLDFWLATLVLLGLGLPATAIGVALWRRKG